MTVQENITFLLKLSLDDFCPKQRRWILRHNKHVSNNKQALMNHYCYCIFISKT